MCALITWTSEGLWCPRTFMGLDVSLIWGQESRPCPILFFVKVKTLMKVHSGKIVWILFGTSRQGGRVQ